MKFRKALLGLCLAFSTKLSHAQDQVLGAGATFPAPVYRKWIQSFQQKLPGMPIQFEATGSGDGLLRFQQGKLDFAASDMVSNLKPDPSVLVLPAIAGAVVPVYNTPALTGDLRFSPELLARIYLGTIRKWNDNEIKSLNRGAALPNADIVVIHRSDDSGTTFVFSDFLSKTNSEWKSRMGSSSSLNWPTGEGVVGNDGVAAKVTGTMFSIGYVEFTYAVQRHLSFGAVRNAAGKFVRADIDSVTAAVNTAQMGDDFKASVTNAAGKDAYPLASFSWLIVPGNRPHDAKSDRLIAFLEWALSVGQREAAALGYVPLPEALSQRERQALANFRK